MTMSSWQIKLNDTQIAMFIHAYERMVPPTHAYTMHHGRLEINQYYMTMINQKIIMSPHVIMIG